MLFIRIMFVCFFWSWILSSVNFLVFFVFCVWEHETRVVTASSRGEKKSQKWEIWWKILITQLLNACNWSVYVRKTLAACVWISSPKGAHFSSEGKILPLFIFTNPPESLVQRTHTHTHFDCVGRVTVPACRRARLVAISGNEMQLSSVSVFNSCLLQCSPLCLMSHWPLSCSHYANQVK